MKLIPFRFLSTIQIIVLAFSFFFVSQVVWAGQLPSVFRGVVVVDSSLGVKVVSVEEASQAYLADLRPEDLIVRVNESDVRSIDEFAAVSMGLKGKAVSAVLLVFRNGTPRNLTLHLYSYPVLDAWGIEFVPDYDFHFVEPQVGYDYWFRLGRGFEGADKLQEALKGYLNGLHNLPQDLNLGLRASLLWSRLGQEQLRNNKAAEGLSSLRNSVVMMQKLFDYPLNDEQLQAIKEQLQSTVQGMRTYLKDRRLSSILPNYSYG